MPLRSNHAHILGLIALFLVILLPLFIFAHLAAEVRENELLRGDVSSLLLLHRLATPERDGIIAGLTNLANYLAIPAFLIVAFGLRGLKQARGAAFFAVTVIGAWLLNICAKTAFQRARPALWVSLTPRSDYGFPSGHAMLSMTIALIFILLAWPTRLRWPVIVAGTAGVLLIGLSRLYLGVHYPSDIIGGWCAGFVWTLGVYFTFLRGAVVEVENIPQWLRRS